MDSITHNLQICTPLNSGNSPDWQAILKQRGILWAALEAGWTPDGAGWRYPLHDANGQPTAVYRWKAFDSAAKPKYRWLPNKPAGYDYYFPAGAKLAEAVAAADGTLIVANGEPALLALQSAGFDNVVCWFGEGQVPARFAEDCAGWGVRRVLAYPDRDRTGELSARKIAARLLDTPIAFQAYRLPETVGDRGDLNELWRIAGFDGDDFRALLAGCEELAVNPHPPAPSPILKEGEKDAGSPVSRADDNDGDFPQALIDAGTDALGVTGAPLNGTGFTRRPIACIARQHEHDDHRPAAYWNAAGHFLHCHKCGESFGLVKCADMLGIDRRAYRPHREQGGRGDLSAAPAETFTPDMTVNLPFISALDADALKRRRVTIIRSAIGTGKTELAKRLADALSRVLVVSHRVALSDNLSDRLGCHNYREVAEDAQLLQMDKLVIVANSLHKLVPRRADAALPAYDLLVIDEVEQVLAHLTGDTFDDDEGITALNVLRTLIQTAGQVLAMDAHAGDGARNFFLDTVSADAVQFIDNAYRPKRGELAVWDTSEGMLARADSLIAERSGPVVIATSSRGQAKTIARRCQERLGREAVFMVCSDNSGERAVQHFINHIESELPRYRVFIYSPSLGTGIDIQTPVRAVFGVFLKDPLTGADCHQMLGRCRSAGERHAYVETVEGNREIEAGAIYTRHYDNALRTSRRCSFDAFGSQQLQADHERYLRLTAGVEAGRNASLNVLKADFVRLGWAAGYFVTLQRDGGDERVRDELAAAHETVAAEDKERVLTSEPISPELFEAIVSAGHPTPEQRAGLVRWRIEETYGQPVTSALYDAYDDGEGRQALLQFCDLFAEGEVLRARDRTQAERRIPLSRRGHFTIKRALIAGLLRAAFGELSAGVEVNRENLEARVGAYIDEHGDDLRSFFGWRTDNSQRPQAALRWVLKRVGLKLVTGGRGDDATYSLCPEALATMHGYRQSRLAAIAEREAAQAAEGVERAQAKCQRRPRRAKTWSQVQDIIPDFCEAEHENCAGGPPGSHPARERTSPLEVG